MRQSLRAHVLYLDNTIRELQRRLAAPDMPAGELEDLQLQLTLAQSAVEYYRRAYELELSVSGSEPPSISGGSGGGGGDEAAGNASAGKKDKPSSTDRRAVRRRRTGILAGGLLHARRTDMAASEKWRVLVLDAQRGHGGVI